MSNIRSLVNQDNLIYKAGIFLQDRFGIEKGAKIELEKCIPIGAGLGGGSSNAATTIKGLSELWDLNLSKAEMHEIAERFGSDINFFLEGYQAVGTHRGERIHPICEEHEFDNILLVNPGFEVSSREAYDLVREKGEWIIDEAEVSRGEVTGKYRASEEHLERVEYESRRLQSPIPAPKSNDPEFCFNRLEEGILSKYPILQETINSLREVGAVKAMLSGSGPTMIGFFENSQQCENAQKLMKSKNFWCHITKTRRRQKK